MEKSLSNKEINEAVARKLGWEAPCKGHILSWYREGDDRIDIPNYCTDITAAWEIVENIKDRDIRFSIEIIAGQARCDIVTMDEISIVGRAETPEMAICLAFFKLP